MGGHKVLKPALRLMKLYRLAIDEIQDGQAVTRYTRWIDAVEVRGALEQEVYLSFSPRFEHIWLESKRRLLEYVAQKPANIGLRSQYALRLYGLAKKYASVGTTHIVAAFRADHFPSPNCSSTALGQRVEIFCLEGLAT